MTENPLLIILGPTASGKTRLAVSLAAELDAEIISADSRQIFRGMDIGTGKDLDEYTIDGKQIPYHLIDIRKAGDSYNVNEFKYDFYRAYADILSRGKMAILCGGTGMYIHSLLQHQPYTAVPVDLALRNTLLVKSREELRSRLQNYPSELTRKADLSSSKRMIRAIEIAEYLMLHELENENRPELSPLVIGLTGEVGPRRERIERRLDTRLETGLIAEVASLLAQGVSPEMLRFYGMEYKYVTAYLQEELTRAEMQEKLYIAIRQFAKRQMTFFRKMEKDEVLTNWISADLPFDQIRTLALEIFKKYRSL